jgi:hypothetical protein
MNSYNTPYFLHKPHPGNIIKSYLMKDIEDELTAKGLI